MGAVTCWAVRALYLWATRHNRFPPPWYEPVAPWLLGSFILLIVVGLLMAQRWPMLGKASAGACFMGILLGGYACVTDHSQG